MRSMKKIIIIAACLVISVFGLIAQLSRWFTKEEKEGTVILQKESEIQEEPQENIEHERYGQKHEWSVYFTHMEAITEDDTFMPYQAFADLVGATERFLEEDNIELVSGEDYELRLNSEMCYKRGNLISFHCYFADDSVTEQEIEYVYDDNAMKYTDIHWTKKGEWNIEWKRS